MEGYNRIEDLMLNRVRNSTEEMTINGTEIAIRAAKVHMNYIELYSKGETLMAKFMLGNMIHESSFHNCVKINWRSTSSWRT